MLPLMEAGNKALDSGLNAAVHVVATWGLGLLYNIIAAAIIFLLGCWIAKLLQGLCARLLARAKVDQTLIKFLSNIVYALLVALVVIAALSRLGVNTTSLAAVMAAAGLAVGLALQGSLSNFAAGVLLIIFKPFRIGDYVEAGGTSGVVEEIHIFNTMLCTGDNKQVIVPNSQVSATTITNYSTKNTRRIDLEIGCGYDDDLRMVRQFFEKLIAEEKRILAEPEPVIAVNQLGTNSVDFIIRPWVKRDDYWPVRWDLTEKIKLGFDANGFSIPYPQQDVHLHGEQTSKDDSD